MTAKDHHATHTKDNCSHPAEFGVRRVMASAPKRGKKGSWSRAETKYFVLMYKIDGSRLDFLVTPMTLLARLLLWKRKT